MRVRIKEIIERNCPEADELSIEGAVDEILEIHEEEVTDRIHEEEVTDRIHEELWKNESESHRLLG